MMDMCTECLTGSRHPASVPQVQSGVVFLPIGGLFAWIQRRARTTKHPGLFRDCQMINKPFTAADWEAIGSKGLVL